MAVNHQQSEAASRGARMLRTALGPAVARFLEDPAIVEVMLNPDGRLWIDRLSNGLSDTGERLSAADGERIVRLVAHHVGAEVHDRRPRVSAELPETGERFEGLLPPVVTAPVFAIRMAMMNLAEYRRTATRLADFLPWAALVGEGVVLNKDGSFQRTARFRGPDLDSAVAAELVAVASRLNNAFRRLGSGWAIFVEAQRHEAASYPASRFADAASALVDAERKADSANG